MKKVNLELDLELGGLNISKAKSLHGLNISKARSLHLAKMSTTKQKQLWELPFELVDLILCYLEPADMARLHLYRCQGLEDVEFFTRHFTNRFFLYRIMKDLLKLDLSMVVVSMIPDIDSQCIRYSPDLFAAKEMSWFLLFEKLYQKIIYENKSTQDPHMLLLPTCVVCKLDFKKKLGDWVNGCMMISNTAQNQAFSWLPHCNNQRCVFFKETGTFGSKKGNAYDYGWF